jgi:dTDP-4-amino-4,6-dideoxygalactose transaminase
MKISFVDLQTQYRNIKAEIDSAIKNVLDNSQYILGSAVSNFEMEFAKYLGCKHFIGVSSGTDALHIALRVLNIGAGDEVITVANTFIATAEAVSLVGAVPVFVDINEETYNIDIAKIESKITNKTKAIIPVHLYGQAVDMDPLMQIAKKYNLFVIEDACQAHGATYNGKKLGTIGEFGCFSFYPGKNLGTYGEGGGITTDNDEYAELVRKVRDHGSNKKYHHDVIGGNFRLSGLEGAVLGVKFKYLDGWNEQRRANAQLYCEFLKEEKNIILPKEPEYSRGNYHLFVVRTKRRDELQKFLNEREIQTGIHYPVPIHLQPAYEFLHEGAGSYPVAEKIAKEILSLPMYPELTRIQIEYVCKIIKNFYKNRYE